MSSGCSTVILSFLSWLGDAALLAAFALACLLSVMIATWWGELAGIRPHRDKSGLGGFAAIYLVGGMRWVLLVPAVVGGDAGPWFAACWARLLAHVLLGLTSVWLFGRGVALVQRDRLVPTWIGVLGAVLLPAPALWLGASCVWSTNQNAAAIATALLLLLHALGFRNRWRARFRIDPPPPPSDVFDTDRGGR